MTKERIKFPWNLYFLKQRRRRDDKKLRERENYMAISITTNYNLIYWNMKEIFLFLLQKSRKDSDERSIDWASEKNLNPIIQFEIYIYIYFFHLGNRSFSFTFSLPPSLLLLLLIDDLYLCKQTKKRRRAAAVVEEELKTLEFNLLLL